jgi:nanoRNase/pAp phosphatase (c-di-AMP/oligoRNAs hydrolase)
MSFAEITRTLDSLDTKFASLLCHHNADPDAICSAYAFTNLLKQTRPTIETEIGAAHGISRLSKHILQHVPIDVKESPSVERADVILLFDTNTIQQLNGLAEAIKKRNTPIIVIDHHAVHPDTQLMAKLCITDENSSSTCEIIYKFYKETNTRLGENEARALFLGIAFDTRHFVLANSSTLKTVAELVDLGVDAQEILPLLSLPMDFSERVARLKACRRAKLFKINEWVVALSHVSAYQASAARALIELGADVTAVAGQEAQNIEISLRATTEFSKKTGIHLGKDIAKPLGEYIHGMGGGHSTAAGANGTGDVEPVLKRCLTLFKEALVSQ